MGRRNYTPHLLAILAIFIAVAALWLALDVRKEKTHQVEQVAKPAPRPESTRPRPSAAPGQDKPAPRGQTSPATGLRENTPQTSPSAGEPPPARGLDRKISDLNRKVSLIEEELGPARDQLARLEKQEADKHRRKERLRDNRHRFRQREEEERLSAPESFAGAGDLYRDGLEEMRAEGGVHKLSRLVEQFPETNRAGCAAIQLAKEYMRKKDWESAEHYLEFASENGAEAFFKDGVAVEPQALFYQGILESKRGNHDAAREIWDTLMAAHPDAMTHSGVPLEEVVESELAQMNREEAP